MSSMGLQQLGPALGIKAYCPSIVWLHQSLEQLQVAAAVLHQLVNRVDKTSTAP
jgi:hypothetical protein